MLRRSFASSARRNRAKPLAFGPAEQVKLRAPVAPTHRNFDVSPTHPLWAFFPQGSELKLCFRDSTEIQEVTLRAWTMAELRRKSFDDLHCIWYEALKERNVVGREIRLAQSIQYDGVNKHVEIDEDLALVQKRIKAVLLERQTAFERVQVTHDAKRRQYLQDFRQSYLEAAGLVEFDQRLVRLQYALFGIPPQLEDLDLEEIDVRFIEGVEYVSDLKFARHQRETGENLPPLQGVVEQLPFFLKDAEVAAAEVTQLREQGVATRLDKIDVLPFLRLAIGNYIAAEVELQ